MSRIKNFKLPKGIEATVVKNTTMFQVELGAVKTDAKNESIMIPVVSVRSILLGRAESRPRKWSVELVLADVDIWIECSTHGAAAATYQLLCETYEEISLQLFNGAVDDLKYAIERGIGRLKEA